MNFAFRTLTRTPGFTAIVVATLALGIGANTAIFSVVHAVLLRPLPFPRPGELMALYESLPSRDDRPGNPRMAITPPTTRDWAGAESFAGLTFYAEGSFILTGAGEPERIPGADVSWRFFETLGTAPIAGRLLTRDDDRPNQPLVAVIGHELWRARFGGDPAIIGRTIELSGRRHAVIGIAGPGFAFPDSAQIWVPLALPEEELRDNQRLSFYLRGVGRLRAHVPPAQAEAELSAIAARLAGRFPHQYQGRVATVVPLRESIVGDVKQALFLLLGTVGCVLLVACVNVANLLLARATGREREIAIRVALGATRVRILRQLLTESLLLAGAGAVGGVLLAMWARDAIVALAPGGVPRIADVRLDLTVLAFTAALTVLAGLAFGLVPALAAIRRPNLPAGARRATADRGRQRLRNSLVVVELALSIALLAGAGLLTRTFVKLINVDPGFSSHGVMTMEVVLPTARYREAPQRAAFFERVGEMLAANPLIESSGGATNLPLSSTQMTFGFFQEGMNPESDAPFAAGVRGVTAGYFRTLGIPLLRGRDLGPADREGSPPVVIINEAMRRRFWPDGDPLGQRISITRGRTIVWREIVGIVGDIRHAGLNAEPGPEIYMPHAHDPFSFLRFVVRSSAEPQVLAGAMRAAVWAVDPTQPVSRVRPMDDVVASSIADLRFNAIMAGTFAVLALILAAVGLYGVISHSVSLRLHEFGVRVALGAADRHVLGLVLRQSLGLAAAGLASGLGLAALLTRSIEAQLYQTPRMDPSTLGSVAGVLVLVALGASYVPARRALGVEPAAALRAE